MGVDKQKIVAELRRLKMIMFDSGLPLSGTAMTEFGRLANRVEAGEFDSLSPDASPEGGGVSLPKLTPELERELEGTGLVHCGGWTQDAVDFVAVLNRFLPQPPTEAKAND